MFEGRTITLIKPIGGLVAGQQKTYELWTQGGIITITDPKNVKAIDKIIKEVNRLNEQEDIKESGKIDLKEYLAYQIDQEGIFN